MLSSLCLEEPRSLRNGLLKFPTSFLQVLRKEKRGFELINPSKDLSRAEKESRMATLCRRSTEAGGIPTVMAATAVVMDTEAIKKQLKRNTLSRSRLFVMF